MNQNQRHRHAYLHATLAGETEHVVAAALELRAHKNKQGITAGHLFVDSAQAKDTAKTILFDEMGKLRAGKTWQQFTQNARDFQKYQNLKHAAAHLIDLSDPNANAHLSGPQDKLYVKGHGSPSNARGISTVARTTSQQGQGFMKETVSVRHEMRDVATGVMSVGDKLGQDMLDVRLTSCGSGGGYAFDDQTNTINPVGGLGAAGSLRQELVHRDANRMYAVHGYRGSTNSTNPVRFPGGQRHFRTAVKFHDIDHQNPQVPLQPFVQTFGPHPDLSIATRKVTTEQYASNVIMNPGMQQKVDLLNQVRGANAGNAIKRTFYEHQDQGVQVSMRRSEARVKV